MTAPARFRDLVAAEWIKIWALRSTPWTLALTGLFVVGAAVVAARADYANFPTYSPLEQQTHGFALGDAFPLVGYLTLMLVAACTGAGVIVGEYSSGLIRTTTVAVPAREPVVLAKAVVVAALWTAAGAVVATASFATSQAILSGRDADVAITDPGALPALVAAALLAPVCALTGLGLGVLIRHSATTMVTLAVLLVLLPQAFPKRPGWTGTVGHQTLISAWQRLTENYGPPSAVGDLYATFTGSWLVYAAWPAIATAVALVAIRRRDV